MNHENIMLNERKTGRWEQINVVLIYLDEIMQMKTFTKRKLDVNTFECKRKSKNFPVRT